MILLLAYIIKRWFFSSMSSIPSIRTIDRLLPSAYRWCTPVYELLIILAILAPLKMTIKLPKRPLSYPLLIHIARKYHYRIRHPDCHFRLSRLRECCYCVCVSGLVIASIVGWRYNAPLTHPCWLCSMTMRPKDRFEHFIVWIGY
jgi:hypothetical protein